MALTPEQIRAQGYTILQDPSEIKDYKIVGQYGKSKTPGSFLYGTPLPKTPETPVVPPTNQLTETSVSPIPAPSPAPITTGEAYKGYLPAENQEINKAEEDYLASLKSKIAPVDEASIRAEKLKQFQAEIDAVNQAAAQRRAEILRTEGLAGEQRLGQTTAIQARRGLLGSDFGASQSEMTRENTRQIIAGKTSLVDAERANAVAGILGQARGSADEEIKAKIAAREAGSKEYIDFLKGQAERKAQNAAMTLSNFLSANQEPTDQDYSEIAKLFGQSVSSLKTKFKTEKEALEAKKVVAEAEKIKNLKAGLTEVDGALIDASGKVVYRAPEKAEGFSLSEGQARYDSTGKLIAQRGKTYKPGSGGGSTGALAGETNPQLYAGLDSKTATAIRSKVTAFKTEPIVQNFNVINEGYNFAKSLPTNTTNPADDQALIYSLAKALDPGSVVREGEYATAQKYAQSWVKAYGKGVEQALLGNGFLSESARQNIKSTIRSRYNTSKQNYSNVYNEYANGINALTGRQTGAQFLTDYSKAFQESTPQQMTLPNGITVTLQADGTYK